MAIPTAKVQTVTPIMRKYGMTEIEDPDASEVEPIPGKVRDLAALDPHGIFVVGIGGSVDEHAVDVLAEVAAK